MIEEAKAENGRRGLSIEVPPMICGSLPLVGLFTSFIMKYNRIQKKTSGGGGVIIEEKNVLKIAIIIYYWHTYLLRRQIQTQKNVGRF